MGGASEEGRAIVWARLRGARFVDTPTRAATLDIRRPMLLLAPNEDESSTVSSPSCAEGARGRRMSGDAGTDPDLRVEYK